MDDSDSQKRHDCGRDAKSWSRVYGINETALVIMYVDLVGSIHMNMTLPTDKLVSIIRAFTYEMSCVIQSHKGYVLKYVGDKVIAFFPSSYNKLHKHCSSPLCGHMPTANWVCDI